MNYTFHLPYAVYRYLAAPLIGVMLLFTLISCGDQNSTVEQRAQDTSAVQDIERNLTFNDVTLEQADAQGDRFG